MKCPECNGEIPIPTDVINNEIISCIDCGMDYEVKISLTKAETLMEDWGQ